jgi:hypothetical protein
MLRHLATFGTDTAVQDIATQYQYLVCCTFGNGEFSDAG